jgi:phosphatidylserine/phosphatidylglycerophosphate/cardiolipin synthase-like enzyme
MENTAQSFENSRELQLLEGSIAFFPSLIDAIENATKSVQMETYIFDLTASGADSNGFRESGATWRAGARDGGWIWHPCIS